VNSYNVLTGYAISFLEYFSAQIRAKYIIKYR